MKTNSEIWSFPYGPKAIKSRAPIRLTGIGAVAFGLIGWWQYTAGDFNRAKWAVIIAALLLAACIFLLVSFGAKRARASELLNLTIGPDSISIPEYQLKPYACIVVRRNQIAKATYVIPDVHSPHEVKIRLHNGNEYVVNELFFLNPEDWHTFKREMKVG